MEPHPTTARTLLEPSPLRLVEGTAQRYGRFGTPVGCANLLDARIHGLPRPLRRWRLKEWEAVQITSPDLFANLALFDAKVMSLVQAKIFERARSKKTLHEWKLRPLAFTLADTLLASRNVYRDQRGGLSFDNAMARGRIVIDLDFAATHDRPQVSGRITLLCDRGVSQVVSLPFEGAGGMYSHKGLFPVEGTLTVGERTYTLRPEESLALLDDHKGYYPYVMRWDWVTGATFVSGEAIGFNLTKNQCRDPETYNENCVFRGDAIGILPAATFEREEARTPRERWRIRDRDGRIDLTFTPTVPGDVRVNALVVESRYRGPFGTFRGRLEPEGTAPVVVDDWFGMGEDFYLRC